MEMTVIGTRVEHRGCNPLGMIDPKGTFGLLYFGSQVLPQIIKSNPGLGSSSEAHLTMKIHHHWECFFVYLNIRMLPVGSHLMCSLFLRLSTKFWQGFARRMTNMMANMIIPLTWLDIEHCLTNNLTNDCPLWNSPSPSVYVKRTKEAKGNLASF